MGECVASLSRAHPWRNLLYSTQSPWLFALPSLIMDVLAVGGVQADMKASYRRTYVLMATILSALALSGCGDECSSYSEFSCEQIQNADYNVYFNFPSGTETYHLGQAKGLQECGAIASNYAAYKQVSTADWGYVCCMIARGSSCYEKHR
jgi:hypothetical protein